jgi:hypothetical protein
MAEAEALLEKMYFVECASQNEVNYQLLLFIFLATDKIVLK